MNDRYAEDTYADTSWTPPDTVTTHGDTRIDPTLDFFAPPPEEIGRVLSANSTLKKRAEPWSPGARYGLAVLVASLAGVAAAVGLALVAPEEPVIFAGGGLVLGAVGFLIVLLTTTFSGTCDYVGTEGVARFKCSGGRENVTRELFPFEAATELRTTQVRRYVNGVYQGTTYSFNWTDSNGRQRYAISGTHGAQNGMPPPRDAYQYAAAAELAWSNYLLRFVEAQLKEHGAIYFSLGGNDWVSVAPKQLELSVRGQTTTCSTSEIGSIQLQQGLFTVKRTDAKEGWFSSSGVFKFNYNALANARLFAFVLEKLVGKRIW
jgi:hypothetical protein